MEKETKNNIRLLQKSEIEEVMTLYRLCGEHMRNNGIEQWGENYPIVSTLEEDIEANQIYALHENKKIKAVVTINDVPEEAYADVKWLTNSDSKNLYIHRLATHPNFQEQGCASILMDFCENYAKQNNFDSIRLDTYTLNKGNVNFYKKRENYTFLEEIDLEMGHKGLFVCIEMVI